MTREFNSMELRIPTVEQLRTVYDRDLRTKRFPSGAEAPEEYGGDVGRGAVPPLVPL